MCFTYRVIITGKSKQYLWVFKNLPCNMNFVYNMQRVQSAELCLIYSFVPRQKAVLLGDSRIDKKRLFYNSGFFSWQVFQFCSLIVDYTWFKEKSEICINYGKKRWEKYFIFSVVIKILPVVEKKLLLIYNVTGSYDKNCRQDMHKSSFQLMHLPTYRIIGYWIQSKKLTKQENIKSTYLSLIDKA